MSKIIDTITFFDNNFIFDFRYNILEKYVDKFVVCESTYDHKGIKKEINFDPENKYRSNKKILHVVLKEPFPKNSNEWQNQAIQREFILKNLDFTSDDDYIMFSDPDEIPHPEVLAKLNLKKKFGIFSQLFFNYKFNLFNPYETPWEGTRVCKKKNLKSIEYLRNNIKAKNLKYNFFRFDKEKNIEVFENAGWHFNNIMSPEQISLKLKTFAHTEFNSKEFYSVENIRNKIDKKIDLFNRGHNYRVVEIDDRFPEYLQKNKEKYRSYITK